MQPKSEAEKELQRLFELIRHFVGGKHQVPAYLTASDLIAVLSVLVGEKA